MWCYNETKQQLLSFKVVALNTDKSQLVVSHMMCKMFQMARGKTSNNRPINIEGGLKSQMFSILDTNTFTHCGIWTTPEGKWFNMCSKWPHSKAWHHNLILVAAI